MLRKGIGIDIGTTQISISSAEGGLLLKDLSVAAIDLDTEKVVEAGAAAVRYYKEFPDKVSLCWPVWDTVVKQMDVLCEIFRIFLRRALGHTAFKPVVMASIPSDLTEAQTGAVEDALLFAGAHSVHFLEAPLCAALGVGFDFSVPMGQMIIHVGASRTEVAVVFLGDMVTYITEPVGGNKFDEAIVSYLETKYRLHIGKRTAEQIKMRIAVIAEHDEPKTLDVKGRCLDTNEQRVVTLSSKEMLGALREPLARVLDTIISVVERTDDEMRADIARGGMVLTGGGILPGMDQFLADIMDLRTCVATNAETAAVEGAARALSKI